MLPNKFSVLQAGTLSEGRLRQSNYDKHRRPARYES